MRWKILGELYAGKGHHLQMATNTTVRCEPSPWKEPLLRP